MKNKILSKINESTYLSDNWHQAIQIINEYFINYNKFKSSPNRCSTKKKNNLPHRDRKDKENLTPKWEELKGIIFL